MTSSDQEIRSADGTRLVVRREGAGEPVVLLHGSGGGLHSWAPVTERLADSYELWTPARRGYGPSDVPPGRTSFPDEVADVIAVIEAAGRPVHLVGGSYGGTLALHTAVAEPGRLRSLAVFEPPLFAAGPATVPLLDRYRAACERDDAGEMSAVRNEVTRVPPAIIAAFAARAGDHRAASPTDLAEARRAAIGWRPDLEALAPTAPMWPAGRRSPSRRC